MMSYKYADLCCIYDMHIKDFCFFSLLNKTNIMFLLAVNGLPIQLAILVFRCLRQRLR